MRESFGDVSVHTYRRMQKDFNKQFPRHNIIIIKYNNIKVDMIVTSFPVKQYILRKERAHQQLFYVVIYHLTARSKEKKSKEKENHEKEKNAPEERQWAMAEAAILAGSVFMPVIPITRQNEILNYVRRMPK